MSDTETEAVLAANRAFYDAFAARDLEAVTAIWARTAPIACIHPGWPALAGRDPVLASWEQILGTPSAPDIRCRAERVLFPSPGTALVLCEEVIGNAVLAASNLFVAEEGTWRLAHHQASLIAPAPPAGQPAARVLH